MANQAKSEFLSSMSHELRTPMNSILGFGQLLEHNPAEPLSESQTAQVGQILKSGDHLLELIDHVLELSKIESGNFSLSIENIAPEEVVLECVNMVRTQAEDKSVDLEFTSPDFDVPLVMTDRSRFRQILLFLNSAWLHLSLRQNSCRTQKDKWGSDYS